MSFFIVFLTAVLLPTFATAGTADFLSDQYRPLVGKNLEECKQALSRRTGGWCEIRASNNRFSISSVWPEDLDQKLHMIMGPSSVLHAWNSAAYDRKRKIFYFTGGGHADYGGNEVYQFDLSTGEWDRLTDPSPLKFLYVLSDYNTRKDKPWRRLCWMPDVSKVPASAHTYDGVIFSRSTETIFLYVMRAANGSCLEDVNDDYKDSSLVVGTRSLSLGWYEFNPSKSESRNGLEPLQWRRVFDSSFLQDMSVDQGYPATAEDNDGRIIFGSRFNTVIYDPKKADSRYVQRFTSQADWGDGTKSYDQVRNIIWSIHNKRLLAFDANNGKLINDWSVVGSHGKSIALGKDGRIYSWNGKANIAVFDPDSTPHWKIMEWGINGPPIGDYRVYGKWVYLDDDDLFVGVSTDKTGIWVYKHPQNATYTTYSNVNAQKMIDQARPGDVVVIPPGIYQRGLFVNKSLTLKLRGVDLRSTVNSKSILNISCNECEVFIEDFIANGIKANCLWGNCSGIKVEGRNFKLTLRRTHIINTVIGLLSDNKGGEIRLDECVIENSGLDAKTTTLGHGLYAGDIDKVVVNNSIIRRSFGKGHLFKSRAAETEIINSVIAGLDGRHSRLIDFPCGGHLSVHESVLQQGEMTDNIDLISVGTEAKNCGGSVRPSNVSITNNWIIFDRDESKDEPAFNYGFNRFFTWRAPIEKIVVTGNRIVESTGRFQFDGEDHVPDLSDGNRFYSSRKAAGLGPDQLPDRPSR